jgi:hypothetical protein
MGCLLGVGLAFREELIGWIGKRRSLWVGGGIGGSRGVSVWLLGRIWAKIWACVGQNSGGGPCWLDMGQMMGP